MRYKNTVTGAVIDVAYLEGGNWVAVDEAAAQPAEKTTKKKKAVVKNVRNAE